ncbi:uncharacterized protein LOC143023543 isoform X2 [Oratosquilla oratoria]|uniref:uncharacterized protein LOC143023543 isoform X2 n=1 Tax=Oratosquilla oratoria TaxID=337810 RepID=UPI003F769A59
MILRRSSSSGLKGRGGSWTGTIALLVLLLGVSSIGAQVVDPKSKETTTAAPEPVAEDVTTEPKPVLTGNPQIDYIHDPNLPRELNGYDLAEYPFYKRVPEKDKDILNFTCDGRHDGFYASVPHKCQVYHHCLFGIRYDFLCANYTAFDQKNFICHFVNEVDCENSELYFDRNNALYKEPEVSTTPVPKPANFQPLAARRPLRPFRLQGKRRPGGGPPPVRTTAAPSVDYDYYPEYDYYDYYGNYYYDDQVTTTTTTTQRPRRPPGGRRQRPRGGGGGRFGGPGRPGGPGGPFRNRKRFRPNAPAALDEPVAPVDPPRASRRQENAPVRSQALREPAQEPPQDLTPEQPADPPARRRRPGRPGVGSGRGNPQAALTTTPPPASAAVDYDYYYDYGNEAPIDAAPVTPKAERVPERPARRRIRPVEGTGDGSRRPVAEDPDPSANVNSDTPPTTTTEEPARPIRTNRITIRRPIRRRPGGQEETATTTTATPTTTATEEPTTAAPSRSSRPRFRNRPQSPIHETRDPSPSSILRGSAEVEIIKEEAPNAPEVLRVQEEDPVRVGGGRPQGRGPGRPGRRRPGLRRRQGEGVGGNEGGELGRGSRQRVRATPEPATYDYYEY